MNIKNIIKIIIHLEDAASIVRHRPAAAIAAVRNGLRCWAQRVESESSTTMERGAAFIDRILAAKHACPHAAFGTYNNAEGEAFRREFEASRPAADEDLANELESLAAGFREAWKLTGRKLIHTVTGRGNTLLLVDGVAVVEKSWDPEKAFA